MRAALLLLLALGLTALWFLRDGAGRERPEPVAAPAETRPTVPDEPLRPAEVAVQREVPVPAASASGEPAAVAAPEAWCVVLGRTVDENDAPLTGVVVQLLAARVWTEGVDVPFLPGSTVLRGWERTTDGDGRFRFETPVPTAAAVWLTVEPDPFHDSARVIFGGRDREHEPLEAGERDVGTLRLATTGAIRGRVVDPVGRPIEGARLYVGSGPSLTIQREATTGPDGTYVIGHVPPGTHGLNLGHERHLGRFVKPFRVERQRWTDGGDLVLESSPTIDGIVVDTSGSPVEGVRLEGWPTATGSAVHTRSEADGRFTLYLSDDQRFTLSAEKDGYRPWHVGDRANLFAPGTTDVRVELEARDPASRVAFRIVDAESGTPLERFGITVLPDAAEEDPLRASSPGPLPRPADHPGGLVELEARPGVDLVLVAAPAHLSARVEIEPGTTAEAPQVVRLAGGASITGRVIRDGLPIAGAKVWLETGFLSFPRATAEVPDPDPVFHTEDSGAGMQLTVTGADGGFRFEGVARGTYRVEARADGSAPAERVPLMVKSLAPLHVGDLELTTAATVLGTVLPPPGGSPAGLNVYLDDWRRGVRQSTDLAGRFRFDGLSAGEHVFLLDDLPGVVAPGVAVRATLAVGETREIVLDARDHGTCEITLTIVFGEARHEGVQVTLVSGEERTKLGSTDAEGRVSGSIRASGEARVEVWIPGGGRIVHPTHVVVPRLDQPVDETVVFEAGALLVRLPEGGDIPPAGSVSLTLAPAPGIEGETQWARSNYDAVGTLNATIELDRAARTFRFEALLAGEWQATLEVTAKDAELEQVPVEGGARVQRRPAWSATFPVTIRHGATSRVVVPR